MEKIQLKASKLVRDVLREKCSRKDGKNSESYYKHKGNTRKALCDTRVRCTYCVKVFSDSRYLVKHMMRRHPSELLGLHSELTETTKEHSIHNSERISGNFVESEIQELKKLMLSIKGELDKHLEHSCHRSFLRKKEEPSNSQNSQNMRMYDNRETEPAYKSELEQMKTSCRNFETAIDSLEEKLSYLAKSIQNESVKENEKTVYEAIQRKVKKDVMKHQMKEVSALKEELDHQIVNLQDVIFGQIQEQELKWETRFADMEKEHSIKIQDLQLDLETKINKNSRQNDEILEQKLQELLNRISKRPKYISLGKDAQKCLRASSLQVPVNKVVKQKLLEEVKKPVSKFPNSESPLECCRVKDELKKNPHYLDGLYVELLQLVEEKIHSFNVKAVNGRLRNFDFQHKVKLLQSECQSLPSKYANFHHIKSALDCAADNKVNMLKTGNKEKVFRNLEATNVLPDHQYLQKQCPGTDSKAKKETKKKESYEFVVPTDNANYESRNADKSPSLENISDVIFRENMLNASPVKKPTKSLMSDQGELVSHPAKKEDSENSENSSQSETSKRKDFVSSRPKQQTFVSEKFHRDSDSEASLETLSSWSSNNRSFSGRY